MSTQGTQHALLKALAYSICKVECKDTSCLGSFAQCSFNILVVENSKVALE
uniref:Uncharacterized protein n=1 Tax=Arundo donax TaxID=35708 RepID=A0A0A8Y1S8_ARUDO